ncbi:MAG: methionyl-tRNA formyltransferase [Acidobacteriaceae bacterium]|nr:methionyl-tRNA formyltransferase [Acidobacteriaceae bacterium]MBV9294417.1 methionyl-tRNA formyltransferase [Acidobacteriaceae bacterium]MBV9767222.1 methionyl-tRNA formyltransferase [Acidobacteriaceae bacterium]
MRVVFLGTPEFAVPSLHALLSGRHEVVAVFTQPDRPKGRGNMVTESAVKRAAVAAEIPVYQPSRIRRPQCVDLLRTLQAELMVVVGYGQIIPQSIIDLPKHGILNVHASLLPKYRGAAPIQWAIANGETETGVTIMQIDAGLDTGDMLLKERIAIGPDETTPELSERLAPLGAQLLSQTVEQISRGTVQREPQNNDEATYALILKKEDGLIDWTFPVHQIYNRMRGFQPWPGAYTTFRNQQLLLLRATPRENSPLSPGVLRAENRHLFAGCGHNTALEILELQLAGKRPMSAQAFLNGYKVTEGEMMGENA